MKKIYLLVLTATFSNLGFGQLANYNPEGKYFKISKENIVITINKESDQKNRSALAPLSLPGILGGFVGLGINIVKAILSKQQEKYTATYSASKSENGLIFLKNPSNPNSAALNISSIHIYRITDGLDTSSDIILVPKVESQSGVFRLKVDELHMPYTKAKIKRNGDLGKTIDLSISIKIDAIWKEPLSKSNSDIKINPKSNSTGSEDTLGYALKTASLGESTIIISAIKPSNTVYLNGDYYSSWFQLIPQAAMKFADENNDWKTGWYNLTITVKEANPYAMNSKELSDFFGVTSSDISSLLKQFIPTNSK